MIRVIKTVGDTVFIIVSDVGTIYELTYDTPFFVGDWGILPSLGTPFYRQHQLPSRANLLLLALILFRHFSNDSLSPTEQLMGPITAPLSTLNHLIKPFLTFTCDSVMPNANASLARSGPAKYFVCSNVFSSAKICWPEKVGLVCFFFPSGSSEWWCLDERSGKNIDFIHQKFAYKLSQTEYQVADSTAAGRWMVDMKNLVSKKFHTFKVNLPAKQLEPSLRFLIWVNAQLNW